MGGTGITAGRGDPAKQQQSSLNWGQMAAGGAEEWGIQQCLLVIATAKCMYTLGNTKLLGC